MTIPASLYAKVNPAVLSAGGNPLVLNGLYLTQNTQMPTGTVLSFGSSAAVGAFFGMASAEYTQSVIYFNGYLGSSIKPTTILFAAWNVAARAAFLQSGALALTLTQLQALSGTLILTVDGSVETSATITLSAATSFSDAATLIEAGFTTPGFTVAWNAVNSAFVFTNTTTGASSTLSFATGTLAVSLALTAATGAVLSQGAVIDTATSAISNAAAINQNWATFTTITEPSIGDKTLFGAWNSEQDDEFNYVAWDSDAQASTQGSTTCFGAVAAAQSLTGITLLSGDPAYAAAQGTTLAALALNLASGYMGGVASVNFSTPNGRRSFAYMQFAAMTPTCASLQTAENLTANGYSYYGAVATANQSFTFLYNGQITGPFLSAVRYINQIYLNSQFQLALLTYAISNGGGGPYNPSGYGNVRAALLDPIQAALSYGAIRTNVTLSQEQQQEVNQEAGVNAASVIQTQGFYLQILDPGPEVRAQGGTPIINFWYTDGGDILSFQMASINIL